MPVADKRALLIDALIFAKKVVLTHLRRPLVRFGAEGTCARSLSLPGEYIGSGINADVPGF